MGYFSEMALNKQEELGLPAEQVSAGNAFEDEETFDELPVPSASRSAASPTVETPPSPAFDADDEAEELEDMNGDNASEAADTDGDDAGKEQEAPAKADAATDADEEKRRAEHEAAEAKRKLSPLSVDQRMLTIRQLIKRDLVSQNIGDEALEQATQCLLEKPFGAWYEKDFGHIRGLTRQTAMLMLQHYPEIQAFIPEFRTEADAVFAVSNASKITGFSNWSQVCGSILVTDQNWAYLKENMGFSEEFVREYQPGIVNFLLRGGSSMVRPLYNELQYRNESEKNCEALRRIVQAELMGQFYKLKYFAGDLKQEIHYPIQEAREDVWKQNLSLTRLGLMAKEVDDFYHTIRMGELPHFTCLSCYQGSQRDCLLAAFDSNKKIILVYKDESVVARACLRLTKGSFQQPSTLNFEFADLSKEDVPTGSHAYSEKLVLFLEHIYTSGLKKSEETAAKEMVVALATQKAEELDAVAVLSNQYRGCYPSGRYVSAPIYIYISKSKNGRQYLDSLGGAAVTLAEEQYKQESFLVERAALDRAHAA